MEHARSPPELNMEGGPVTRADAWKQWKQQLLLFVKASGVSSESAGVQASLLVNLIGLEGFDVYQTFSFGAETEEDVVNTTLLRYKFFTRNQEEGESVQAYVTALRLLSIKCGVRNVTVRDRLLRCDDLDLDKAIKLCQAEEASKESGKELGFAVSSVPATEDDQPYLKVNTLKNLFNVGEKKAIFCEGKHLSGDLEWYDPSGEKIQPRTNKNKRIYIEHRPPPSEGPTFLPLMIKSLFLNDSGIYTCKAGNLNATINIFVAEKVVIKEKEQDYDAEEGHSVELSCLAKGTPTPEIQWYKDNIVEPIVTNEKYRITYKSKASTSILKINDLSHMDPGTYRCRATQETISHFVEKICHLRVRHKPVIMNSYSEREVYAIMDEWKNITCKAVAFPAPTFTWSKHTGNYDEELNTDNEEFHITSSSSQDSDTSSVLTLHITNETLDQQYKCSVWNTKGRQNFIFHVSLGNKPDPPTAVTMVSATVNNITFEVACENCTFFKEDGLAPSPENLPVLGYVFQLVPHMAGFAVPYWINGTTYTFDISEYNGTTFTIENLDKDTEYHVRVATRNLAGLSDWYDVQGLPKTTDGAAILAKSIGLFIFTLIVSLTN